MHATFKKVRATETQRLIKKLRFLRTKEGTKEECADLEVQLESIKVSGKGFLTCKGVRLTRFWQKLDLNTLLPRLVLQRLRKHPLTKPKLPLPDDLVPQLPAATISEGLSRVENRLASSKIAAEALTQAVAWIVGAEGGRLGGVQVRNKQQSKAMKQTPSTGKQASTATASPAAAAPRATGVPAQRVPVSTGLGDEDEAAAADAAGWESGSVRGGSDDESDDDDDDDDEDGDDSDDSGAILSDQEDIPPPPSKKAKLAPPPAPKPGVPVKSSMFLPSLAVGYTAGGSDDDFDPSDDERRASKSGRGVATERKNRRGQQERRKIWEAKYGRGANHLKQEKELEKAKKFMPAQGQGEAKPDSGWGGRAASSKPTKYRFGKRAEKDAAQAPAAAAPPPVPALPAPVKTGPPSGKAGASHPSWEAARLRKQKEMAAASAALGAPGAVKPKKIVFD